MTDNEKIEENEKVEKVEDIDSAKTAAVDTEVYSDDEDTGYGDFPSFGDAAKARLSSFINGLVSGVKESGRFFKNPVRYVKAAKGKNYLAVKSDFDKIEHDENNVLEVRGVKKYFPIKKGLLKRTVGYVRAVDGVSFDIKAGTTMGLVGESGCGKTTIGRTVLRLIPETSGEIRFRGKSLTDMTKKELRAYRPNIQIVFQDPYSSLSPRLPVGEIIGEAVRQHNIVPKDQYDDYISKIMRDCGLQEYHKNRYPHEFSGGQRQRICIARALALNPKFIVCDEPVSALDVSIQAQIINLLKDLQEKYALTYLFISHDLSVVEHISDTVGVMYLGSLVEYAATEKIFSKPLHPYTEALFSAIPVPDPDYKMNRIILEGSIPSPANPPSGCKFHTRCRDCKEICKHVVPTTVEAEEGHFVACHKYCSKDQYYDPDYKYVAERTAEYVRAELEAKIAALYADVPLTKQERIAEIEKQCEEEENAKERKIRAHYKHKIDLLEHDRIINKYEIEEARALMYQKLYAFPEAEREAQKKKLEEELKIEIAEIKKRKIEKDNNVERRAEEFTNRCENDIIELKSTVAAKKADMLAALDEEIADGKADAFARDCAADKARADIEAKALRREYKAEIKALDKAEIDKYVQAYAEKRAKEKAEKAEKKGKRA